MSWPLRRALATTATRSVILVGFGGHNVAVGLIDRTRGYLFVSVNCPTSVMPRRKKSAHPVR